MRDTEPSTHRSLQPLDASVSVETSFRRRLDRKTCSGCAHPTSSREMFPWARRVVFRNPGSWSRRLDSNPQRLGWEGCQDLQNVYGSAHSPPAELDLRLDTTVRLERPQFLWTDFHKGQESRCPLHQYIHSRGMQSVPCMPGPSRIQSSPHPPRDEL